MVEHALGWLYGAFCGVISGAAISIGLKTPLSQRNWWTIGMGGLSVLFAFGMAWTMEELGYRRVPPQRQAYGAGVALGAASFCVATYKWLNRKGEEDSDA